MSEYNNSAKEAKRQLDRISDSMCYAKWSQVSLHLTNGMTQSCYHPPTHKVDLHAIQSDPSALHNTERKKSEREKMLKGIRPSGCEYCWRIEDAGGISDRVYRSGEYWAQNARKDIIASTATDLSVNPRYVEVNFNQACNFKCLYCSPHLSTEWEKEVKDYGPLDIIGTDNTAAAHNDITYLEQDGLMPMKVANRDNPYVDAFWKWWPDLYKTLEVFRMTGGEPLMDKNTYKVLDYIYENPNAWLELSITTNMCPPKDEMWDKFLAKVKKLEEIQIWQSDRWNPGSGNNWYVNMAVKNMALFVSVDSVGEDAEYIRTGLDFAKMKKNCTEFLDETCNTTLTFINTFNVMSVPRIKEYLEFILELRTKYDRDEQGITEIEIYDEWNTHEPFTVYPRQRVWFDIPLLRYPDWFAINILDEFFDHYLEDAIDFMEEHRLTDDNFSGFYDFEIDKLRRNLDWMRTEREKLSEDHIDRCKDNLVKYTEQIDTRRGTDFKTQFPELYSYAIDK